jgi:2-hydroxy-6-oxonona-2,4-dienedioate hydrolase
MPPPRADASATRIFLLDHQHSRSLRKPHEVTSPGVFALRARFEENATLSGERKRMLQKTATADVNGARLHYEVVGEGEPLVLVHAGIADSRMWDAQIEAFAHRYRVFRYDMRGFGKTAMVKGPYSHHEDLRSLLDYLGVRQAHLVGCSMGGATVLDFALRFPERVAALVLVGSAVSGFEVDVERPKQWDELVAADEAGDLERVSELEVQIWVDGPGRQPEDVPAAVRDLVREMNLIALRSEASELGEELPPEPPAVDRLVEIGAPSLVIVGDSDQPRITAAADLLERELPNVRKVVMPGVAHLPNMERPVEFNRIVLDHLQRSV